MLKSKACPGCGSEMLVDLSRSNEDEVCCDECGECYDIGQATDFEEFD